MTILDATAPPRFGGVLWRLARRTTRLAMPIAGRRGNPIFAVVIHRGRRTGREWATPVAARRVADGFVLSLAFGAQADWHRNLVAAGGGVIRWRGIEYPVRTPEPIDPATALPAFNVVQRLALRASGIRLFIHLSDGRAASP
jgi:deazaflavin-dependent oxidoreductase (nitroreductase family)